MDYTLFSEKQLEAFNCSTARINIFHGSVRSGKTHISIIRFLEFIRSGPKGDLAIVGRTDKTIKRNIIMPMMDMVGSGIRYSSGKGELYVFNRTVHIIGANDDRSESKIRGSTLAGALVDEATLVPESFFKMLLSRLSVDGAKLFATTNPDSPYHWLKRDYLDRADELDIKSLFFVLKDNPALSKTYIDELSKEYTGMWYDRYILGKWVVAEGAIFDFFDKELHCIDQCPQNALFYIVGVDYGTVNPTAFSLIGYNPNNYPNMWVEKEYYYDSKKHLRQKTDYEYAQDLKEFIQFKHVKHIIVDPSAASFKNELNKAGIFNIINANNNVLDGIRYMANMISSGQLKIWSGCKNLIQELGSYVWDEKALMRGEDKPIKMNDHILDATRYNCMFIKDLSNKQFSADDIQEMERKYR